jgi:hypothetical protein
MTTIDQVFTAFQKKEQNRQELARELIGESIQIQQKMAIFLQRNAKGKTVFELMIAERNIEDSKVLFRVLHGEVLGKLLNGSNLDYSQRFYLISFAQKMIDNNHFSQAGADALLELQKINHEGYSEFLLDAKRDILKDAVIAKNTQVCQILLKSGVELNQIATYLKPEQQEFYQSIGGVVSQKDMAISLADHQTTESLATQPSPPVSPWDFSDSKLELEYGKESSLASSYNTGQASDDKSPRTSVGFTPPKKLPPNKEKTPPVERRFASTRHDGRAVLGSGASGTAVRRQSAESLRGSQNSISTAK